MAETVNHPSHYGGDTTYEAIKVIEAWDLGFCLGNAIKYICRAGKKPRADGNLVAGALEDLRKAEFYLHRRIVQLEKFWAVVEKDLEVTPAVGVTQQIAPSGQAYKPRQTMYYRPSKTKRKKWRTKRK